MRVLIMFAVGGALALAACGQNEAKDGEAAAAKKAEAASEAAAPELSPPKPGRWRMTSTMSAGPMQGMQMPAIEVCVDKASFDSIQRGGDAGAEAQCDDMSVRREGDAIVTHARCVADGRTSIIDNRVTGDLDSRYTTDTRIQTTPEPAPGAGEVRVTTTAERLGDC